MPRRSEQQPQNQDQDGDAEGATDKLLRKSFLTGAKTYERADGTRYIVRKDGSIEEDKEVKAS